MEGREIMRRGFTLIEIMIAVLVISLGVIPVYLLLTSGTRGVRYGIRQIKAVNHCSAVLELFRGIQYDKIKSMTDMGEMEASQQGYMVYSKLEESWIKSADALDSGKWEVNGSSDAKKFFTYLDPKLDIETEILPYLEVYFTSRSVRVICKPQACEITSKVEWVRDEGKSQSKFRDLEFKTVVVNDGPSTEIGS